MKFENMIRRIEITEVAKCALIEIKLDYYKVNDLIKSLSKSP